jgi:hypothetical protein
VLVDCRHPGLLDATERRAAPSAAPFEIGHIAPILLLLAA